MGLPDAADSRELLPGLEDQPGHLMWRAAARVSVSLGRVLPPGVDIHAYAALLTLAGGATRSQQSTRRHHRRQPDHHGQGRGASSPTRGSSSGSATRATASSYLLTRTPEGAAAARRWRRHAEDLEEALTPRLLRWREREELRRLLLGDARRRACPRHPRTAAGEPWLPDHPGAPADAPRRSPKRSHPGDRAGALRAARPPWRRSDRSPRPRPAGGSAISGASVVQLVDQLEERGLVERRRLEWDRRTQVAAPATRCDRAADASPHRRRAEPGRAGWATSMSGRSSGWCCCSSGSSPASERLLADRPVAEVAARAAESAEVAGKFCDWASRPASLPTGRKTGGQPPRPGVGHRRVSTIRHTGVARLGGSTSSSSSRTTPGPATDSISALVSGHGGSMPTGWSSRRTTCTTSAARREQAAYPRDRLAAQRGVQRLERVDLDHEVEGAPQLLGEVEQVALPVVDRRAGVALADRGHGGRRDVEGRGRHPCRARNSESAPSPQPTTTARRRSPSPWPAAQSARTGWVRCGPTAAAPRLARRPTTARRTSASARRPRPPGRRARRRGRPSRSRSHGFADPTASCSSGDSGWSQRQPAMVLA